jgi:predicted Zn-dependent protease
MLLHAGFAASASSELPSLGQNSLLNIEREKRLGRSVYERILAGGLVETNDNRVRDYRFFIVRDDSVNAFALPGGFIGVHRGLIMQARTQHQLASVMAHEIAHVRLTHGMDMMEKGSELNSAALLSMLAGLLLGGANSAWICCNGRNSILTAWSSFSASCRSCQAHPKLGISSTCVHTR